MVVRPAIHTISSSLAWIALALAGCSFAQGYSATDDAAARSPDAKQAPSPDGSKVVPDATIPPGFVQGFASSSSPWSSSSDSIAAQLTQNVTAGDVIAVYVSFADGASLSKVTDSLANTYTLLDSVDDGHDQQRAATAYAVATASGPDTVTAKLSGSQCCRVILVHEISGVDKAAPLDGHAALEQDSAPTNPDGVTSGSAMLLAAGDYVFAATSDGANTGGQMITAGTGEQLRLVPAIPNGNPTVSEDEIQQAAGSVTSSFTFSQSGGRSLTAEMAFKP
jgi:hypothetical protein